MIFMEQEQQLLPSIELKVQKDKHLRINKITNRKICCGFNNKITITKTWITNFNAFVSLLFIIAVFLDTTKFIYFVLGIIFHYNPYVRILFTFIHWTSFSASLRNNAFERMQVFNAWEHMDGGYTKVALLLIIFIFIVFATATFSVALWHDLQLIRPKKNSNFNQQSQSVPYLRALAKYYFDAALDKKDKFKRLVSINYYLHAVFVSYIRNSDLRIYPGSEHKIKMELDKVYELHKDGYNDEHIIVDSIPWKDIMEKAWRRPEYSMMKSVNILSYIQFLVPLIYLICIKTREDIYWLIIPSVTYGILAMINYIFSASPMFQFGFYSCLILPHWSNNTITNELPWTDTFGSVGQMMKGIKSIHYIMFDQYEEIKVLKETKCIGNEDIERIVAEFGWMDLPSRDKIHEFQAMIDKKFNNELGVE